MAGWGLDDAVAALRSLLCRAVEMLWLGCAALRCAALSGVICHYQVCISQYEQNQDAPEKYHISTSHTIPVQWLMRLQFTLHNWTSADML